MVAPPPPPPPPPPPHTTYKMYKQETEGAHWHGHTGTIYQVFRLGVRTTSNLETTNISSKNIFLSVSGSGCGDGERSHELLNN